MKHEINEKQTEERRKQDTEKRKESRKMTEIKENEKEKI